jgi:cytochrome b6-f complex iron-sulfur subunit
MSTEIGRRCALRLLIGAGAAARCGAPFDLPTGPMAAGKVEDLPLGALKIVGPVAVARDATGLYAMSTLCTHAGCPTQQAGADLFCPCHGSLFDGSGQVLRGPAHAPLPHYQVDLGADGSITVQAGSEVPPSTRTPVP